jgi:hypothetical protein
VAPATRSARFLTQNEAPMSAEEETARHVPVRRSEAAALTGGGGSMSRRRRDAGERSLEESSISVWPQFISYDKQNELALQGLKLFRVSRLLF